MRTLILTGGGSAGHAVPHLALLPGLRQHFRLAYIGTDGIERRIMEQSGLPYYAIPAVKFVRAGVWKNAGLPFRFPQSVRAAKRALQAAGAEGVFSKGGYVALPVALAARSLGLPVVTHESDLTPGLANRLIARGCAAVLTSFPETAQKFKNGIWTGPPLRRELLCGNRARARAKYALTGEKPALLIFGGGSGSRALNEAADGAMESILSLFDVVHIRGGEGQARPGYVPLAYEPDMASAYACADFVLARAGSNTLFELLALKKPALLVPLANKRSRGDQRENAAYFERRGLVRVLPEEALTSEALFAALQELAADADLRRALAQHRPAVGNAAIIRAVCAAMGE